MNKQKIISLFFILLILIILICNSFARAANNKESKMIQVFEEWFSYNNKNDVVTVYAEAVKKRNASVQYALFSEQLKQEKYNEFNDLNWVTGTSSPWVTSYEIQDLGYNKFLIKFYLATSTGSFGDYTEDITLIKSNGNWKINKVILHK